LHIKEAFKNISVWKKISNSGDFEDSVTLLNSINTVLIPKLKNTDYDAGRVVFKNIKDHLSYRIDHGTEYSPVVIATHAKNICGIEVYPYSIFYDSLDLYTRSILFKPSYSEKNGGLIFSLVANNSFQNKPINNIENTLGLEHSYERIKLLNKFMFNFKITNLNNTIKKTLALTLVQDYKSKHALNILDRDEIVNLCGTQTYETTFKVFNDVWEFNFEQQMEILQCFNSINGSVICKDSGWLFELYKSKAWSYF